MSKPAQAITLDHLIPIEIPTGGDRQFFNELSSVNTLWAGLDLLYRFVARVEAGLQGASEEGALWWASGNLEHLGIPERRGQELVCFFHWYSVSACNLIQLIGWIHQQVNAGALPPKEYLNAVAPEIVGFRHHVGAHFEQQQPPKSASRIIKKSSTMYPLGVDNGRLKVNVMKSFQIIGNNPPSSSGDKLPDWSITEVHEKLAARYIGPAWSPWQSNDANQPAGGSA